MDLRVEIPKRFKEGLQQRFDLRRARNYSSVWGAKIYCIPNRCPLCAYYGNCGRCPFGKFDFSCTYWVYLLVEDKCCFSMRGNVCWREENDKEARRQIKKLKRKAKKLITWI